MKKINGIINAGSQTKGKTEGKILAGSFKNFLKGVGAERNAIKNKLEINNTPAAFHNIATSLGNLLIVKQ